MTRELLQNTGFYSDGLFSDRFYPLQPDEWPVGGHHIIPGDAFDVFYFGEGTLRIATGHESIPTLAIKIHVTGREVNFSQAVFHSPRILLHSSAINMIYVPISGDNGVR